MQLDHVTLVTPDLEGACRFFCDIVGLEDGPRPPFRVDGHWLYANGRPVIHLVEATESARLAGGAPAPVAPRIDHVAFRVAPGIEWRALVERLAAHRVPYQLAEVPASEEVQLFVALAPGVVVEFVTSLAAGAAA
ncbi:VOC family protein [Paraburkholderia sp. CNPSo 3272]|uniref:VOC family protein n=1 Tax=Paraburkholderia sp. CNPSo 3272 TaxID=2940931 RepID=UPI0020B822DC|nr:VOC family protein [Paraburkholderia sp. CNPSo 3272]MCP3724860.1 VOC family protein [Paraburkholderia sp. CNPSo 3272]